MHFGPHKVYHIPLFAVLIVLFLSSGCKEQPGVYLSFKSPQQGETFKSGDEIKISLEIVPTTAIKSVRYLIDGKPIAANFSTQNLSLGYKMITAIVAYDDQIDTINTNIILKSNVKPLAIHYKVAQTFPHNANAYTQGLSYEDGKLLESTGEYGSSVLKWVELKTGRTLQETKLDSKYFGEGSVKVDDKVIMLTWQENIGFVFDAKTFKELQTFPYQESREGWGLTFNGKQLLKSDGSNRIWFLNKDSYREEGYIEVYDHEGEVKSLNELEFIDGKIYANVYLTNKIVVINSQTGMVERSLDLSALVPQNYFKDPVEIENNVLNGIAWDKKGKRLFVTGKKWPMLYELKID